MTDPASPAWVGDIDLYRMMRSRLEHEDNLIVNRLSWLMASQSFLFTAYAICANGPVSLSGAHAELPMLLLRLVPAVGAISTGLIYAGILAAVRAMAEIRIFVAARVPDERALGLPPLQAPPSNRAWGLTAPVLLPVVFVLVWLFLLLTRLPG